MGLEEKGSLMEVAHIREPALNPVMAATLAGGATAIGGVCVVVLKRWLNARGMAAALGLAAAVMVTVSLFDMWGREMLETGEVLVPTACAAAGAAVFLLLRRLPVTSWFAEADEILHGKSLPSHVDGRRPAPPLRTRQLRLGVLLAIVLTVHNFPEGLAVALSSLESPRLGIVVGTAIAMHNIPEGIVVAAPVFAATQSPTKAIGLALASGLSEPAGALFALQVLQPIFGSKPWFLSYTLCSVAGLMIAVSVVELIPEALEYKQPIATAAGAALGTVIMLTTMAVV